MKCMHHVATIKIQNTSVTPKRSHTPPVNPSYPVASRNCCSSICHFWYVLFRSSNKLNYIAHKSFLSAASAKQTVGKSSMLPHTSIFHSFLLLIGTPLYTYITIYLLGWRFYPILKFPSVAIMESFYKCRICTIVFLHLLRWPYGFSSLDC